MNNIAGHTDHFSFRGGRVRGVVSGGPVQQEFLKLAGVRRLMKYPGAPVAAIKDVVKGIFKLKAKRERHPPLEPLGEEIIRKSGGQLVPIACLTRYAAKSARQIKNPNS